MRADSRAALLAPAREQPAIGRGAARRAWIAAEPPRSSMITSARYSRGLRHTGGRFRSGCRRRRVVRMNPSSHLKPKGAVRLVEDHLSAGRRQRVLLGRQSHRRAPCVRFGSRRVTAHRRTCFYVVPARVDWPSVAHLSELSGWAGPQESAPTEATEHRPGDGVNLQRLAAFPSVAIIIRRVDDRPDDATVLGVEVQPRLKRRNALGETSGPRDAERGPRGS